MTLKPSLVLCALPLLAVLAAGCGSDAAGNAAGYTKDDFKKTTPPPGWKGPGQPGGPPAGPPVPPATGTGGTSG